MTKDYQSYRLIRKAPSGWYGFKWNPQGYFDESHERIVYDDDIRKGPPW
jgi:hypothetical protein